MVFRGNKGLLVGCDRTLLSPKEYLKLQQTMLTELRKHPTAIAIASNQVLKNNSGRVPAAFLTIEGDLYISPSYVVEPSNFLANTPYYNNEVCLSDMTQMHKVLREPVIRVSYHYLAPTRSGHKLRQETRVLFGQEAAMFQHETDHLNGKPIWLKSQQDYHTPHPLETSQVVHHCDSV